MIIIIITAKHNNVNTNNTIFVNSIMLIWDWGVIYQFMSLDV